MRESTPFTVPNYFSASQKLCDALDMVSIEKAIDLIKSHFEKNTKIITFGNGGSAATASHYITDWNKMTHLATGRKFRGVSLCDNIGAITAYANDLAYDEIFCGQLKALMDKGDLVIGVSGSGNSPNVVKAIQYANDHGATTLAVVGYDGGEAKHLAQHNVWVPSFDMQLCEDIHLLFGHLTMKALCGSEIGPQA